MRVLTFYSLLFVLSPFSNLLVEFCEWPVMTLCITRSLFPRLLQINLMSSNDRSTSAVDDDVDSESIISFVKCLGCD